MEEENIQKGEKFVILPYMFEGKAIQVIFDENTNGWMSLEDYHVVAYQENWQAKLFERLDIYQDRGEIKEISHEGNIFYYADANAMREVSFLCDDIDDGSKYSLYKRLLDWTNSVFCYYAARGDLKLGLLAQNLKEMLDMLEHEGIESLSYKEWMFAAPMKYWINNKLDIKTPIVVSMISKQMDKSVPAAIRLLNHPNSVKKEGSNNVYYRFLLPYIQIEFNKLRRMIEESPEWIISKIEEHETYRKKAQLSTINELLIQGETPKNIIKRVFGVFDESSFEYFFTKVIVDACKNEVIKTEQYE